MSTSRPLKARRAGGGHDIGAAAADEAFAHTRRSMRALADQTPARTEATGRPHTTPSPIKPTPAEPSTGQPRPQLDQGEPAPRGLKPPTRSAS